jgi:tetratricopeptide (TPR) repeat protein
MAVAAAIMASAVPAFAMGSGASDDAGDKYKDAVSAVEHKDYKGAIALLKDVLDSDGRNADALNYMGYSYRKLGNYDLALAYYKKALAVDPDHKGANEYLGEAYLEMKQPTLADAQLARLQTICGTDCDAYKQLKTAIDGFRKTGKIRSTANW